MIKSSNTLSCFMVFMAGVLWGTMAIFSKTLTQGYGFSATEVVCLRGLTCSLIVGIVLLIKDKSLFKIRIKDLWIFAGNGIFSLVLFNVCYFTAINLVGASTACILLYTAPVFVMLMSSLFFKERITLIKVCAMILSFAGCVMVLSKDFKANLAGILIGLTSGVGYALYSIFGKYATKKCYSSLTITFYSFLIAFLFLLPLCDFNNMAIGFSADLYSYLWVLGAGTVVTAIPYFLYTKGIESIENSKAIIIASIEPVVATITGVLCFGQSMGILELSGVATVIFSIVLLNVKSVKNY